MNQRDLDEMHELTPARRPYISNYPALQKWVDDHNGRCLSQELVGDSFFEKWIFGVQIVLIEVRANREGFEVWVVPSLSIKNGEYFADLERHLGMRKGDGGNRGQ